MSLWQKMQTSLSSLWVVWTWKRIEFQLVLSISSTQICLPRTKKVLLPGDWTKVLFKFCCYCQYCKWKNIMLFVVVTMWKFPDLMLLQLYVLWRLIICSLGNFFFATSVTLLQRWLYWREHLKCVWNVYCVATNHRWDLHTTETTGNKRFPICHGTNYFRFV